VLADDDIPLDRRFPYLRFFVWVYLNTASSATDSGTALIDLDKQLWQFIYMVYTHLHAVISKVRGCSLPFS